MQELYNGKWRSAIPEAQVLLAFAFKLLLWSNLLKF